MAAELGHCKEDSDQSLLENRVGSVHTSSSFLPVCFLSVCLKKACSLAGDGVPDRRGKSGMETHSATGSETDRVRGLLGRGWKVKTDPFVKNKPSTDLSRVK